MKSSKLLPEECKKEIREEIRKVDDFLKDPLARRTMPTTMWNRGYYVALKWVLNEKGENRE